MLRKYKNNKRNNVAFLAIYYGTIRVSEKFVEVVFSCRFYFEFCHLASIGVANVTAVLVSALSDTNPYLTNKINDVQISKI